MAIFKAPVRYSAHAYPVRHANTASDPVGRVGQCDHDFLVQWFCFIMYIGACTVEHYEICNISCV